MRNGQKNVMSPKRTFNQYRGARPIVPTPPPVSNTPLSGGDLTTPLSEDATPSSFVPWDHDVNAQRRPFTTLAISVEAILKRLNIATTPAIASVIQKWDDALPPDITKFARPRKIVNGILYVQVSSSIKLFELRRCQRTIIDKAVFNFAIPDVVIKSVRLTI